MDITYLCESIDTKDKPIFKEDITIHKNGDKLYIEMGTFINEGMFQRKGEIPSEVQIAWKDQCDRILFKIYKHC